MTSFFFAETSFFKRGRRKQKDTPWVNFINLFTCSFYACRSRKHKKLLDLTVFFALLGSSSVKAALKMLVKLTPLLTHTHHTTTDKGPLSLLFFLYILCSMYRKAKTKFVEKMPSTLFKEKNNYYMQQQ